MDKIFRKYKDEINKFFTSYFKRKNQELKNINQWSGDVLNKFESLVSKGKMLRGSLVCLAYSKGKIRVPAEVIKAAATLEMLHLALLIHDDIIDKDDIRRGLPTLHVQYKQ